ncbi:MAG: hypothetical protein ACLUE2_01760 [Bacteroides cellulosilyticus]
MWLTTEIRTCTFLNLRYWRATPKGIILPCLSNRIYADAFHRESSATGETYPDATKRLLQLFNRGMLVVNYTGAWKYFCMGSRRIC